MVKRRMLAWLENRREDEEMMARTINIDHENYSGSEEEDCYKHHQYNILVLTSIINYLEDPSTNKQSD